MRKLPEYVVKGVFVFVGVFLLLAVVIAGVQILVDNVCADINASEHVPSLKAVMWYLFACFF